jgi:hypothetical protein
MGMLGNGTPGDMGQDDSIGEGDFGPEGNETSSDPVSGLSGMDPTTGMANIGSWATAKDPNRTMSQVMGLFSKEDDPTVSMAKAYGPKGKGYAYSDSFSSKSAQQHTNFVVDLMDKSFQAKYGKSLKDSKSVHDAMTKDEQDAMIAEAKANTKGILSGIPADIRDEVNLGINVTIAQMMGYSPVADTDAIPDWFGLPKETGWMSKAKAWAKNIDFNAYNLFAKTDATMLNMLGEEPGTQSDVTAMEGGESNQ